MHINSFAKRECEAVRPPSHAVCACRYPCLLLRRLDISIIIIYSTPQSHRVLCNCCNLTVDILLTFTSRDPMLGGPRITYKQCLNTYNFLFSFPYHIMKHCQNTCKLVIIIFVNNPTVMCIQYHFSLRKNARSQKVLTNKILLVIFCKVENISKLFQSG